jgi:succinoglycan biosynthesis transport protein ExoP
LELQDLVRFVRAHAGLILTTTLVAALIAGGVSLILPRSYVAESRLLVGPSLSADVRDYNQLLSAQTLARTYAEAARTNALAARVIERLGLEETPVAFLQRVTVESDRDTSILSISARGDSPEEAATIANAIGEDLIAESGTLQGRDEQILEAITGQIEAVQGQIATLDEQLTELQGLDDPTVQQVTEIQTLQGQIIALRQTLAGLFDSMATGSASSVAFLDRALPPAGADSPRPFTNLAVGLILGLIGGLTLAAVRSSLDDRIRGPGDVTGVVGLPLLGVVDRISLTDGGSPRQRLAMVTQPRSPAAEAFRTIRTNLAHAPGGSDARTIVVTSPAALDGKSTVAANLAVAFAQAGRRTILVDADMRKPSIHELFGLDNSVGLADVLETEAHGLRAVFRPSETPGLRVITSGPIPSHPAELLGTARARAVFDRLAADADIVVIDSPPALAATDAALLATRADGVILVVAGGSTRRAATTAAEEALRRVGGTVLGVVLDQRLGRARDGARDAYEAEETVAATPAREHR